MGALLCSFHVFYSLSRSKALQETASLVRQQLQIVITQPGYFNGGQITQILSALVHLNPFETYSSARMGFTLIADILSSRFQEDDRYLMASKVVQLVGNFFFPRKDDNIPSPEFSRDDAWIPPLLGFLLLSEKLYANATGPLPYAESFALRIVSAVGLSVDLFKTNLPILSSTLLPTHPLQLRCLALKAFYETFQRLPSSRMEDVPAEKLKNLLRAVGDPFLFTEDTSLLDRGSQLLEGKYKPFYTAVLLIEFASSNLWRDHLHPSNFTTCEAFMSTEEGKKTTAGRMFSVVSRSWPRLLGTTAKVVAAIERLEELQCPSTAEVVIMWAWTPGFLYVKDRDAWRLIERTTLSFYQTHGIGRLKALERHLTNKIPYRFDLHHWEAPDQMANGLLQAPRGSLEGGAHFHLSQVCQLRRLYCLFGRGPTGWEAVAGEEEKGTDSSLTVAPVLFMDWACDYP